MPTIQVKAEESYGTVSVLWLLLGDFNSVLRIDDRSGGVPVTLAEVIEFHSYI